MKILFITPHLSTGGAPQYLLKKIIELNESCEVYCIEYSNITGGVLVVQRTQIEEILGNKLITLFENKWDLINHIDNINPDIIHFEEIPEYFCDHAIAENIYIKNRKYKIIETSHDSSFDVSEKRFFPDRFIFVSEYQKQLFSSLNIPSEVVEYPITLKNKTDRFAALSNLGLDPKKIHFLNVGLFTSRKNQSEIIEYANELLNYNVQFHFVGNQADNFKWYWEPLMKKFPSNCKWWGEKKDVDTFYNAMDVFLFTSKGTNHDKETNPLVVREAIGWNLPILMYNLPVYCGMYDKYKNITWLNHDFQNNLNIIKSFILPTDSTKDIFEIEFQHEENKLVINYTGTDVITDVLFSVKDVDSKSCIYSCKWQKLDPNLSMWIMPLPKHVFDFQENPNFKGFLFQVFSSGKHIFEKKIILKNIHIEKPIIDFSDEDPIFINYNEFFVEKIYDQFNIKNLNVSLDIGANVGLFTKYLKLNNCNKIYCFEPNFYAFKQLTKNFTNDESVKLFNLAVSYNNEDLRLYTFENNTLISSACNKTDSYFDIKTVTLNQIFEQNNFLHVDLIKIDIEGMEYDLMEKIDFSLFDKVDRFLIEYHELDNSNEKLNYLVNNLQKNNYFVHQPTKHKFVFAIKQNLN